MRGVLGLLVIVAAAWGLSERRAAIQVRTVVAGLLLQAGLAVLLIDVPGVALVLHWLGRATGALQHATDTGSIFVFGYLGGGALPFAPAPPGAAYILAFQALPLVLTISALASLLYYWGVLQRLTRIIAFLLQRTMGIGGALALGAAVHIFLGMIEAPLLVRPYLARMQRGELFALMSCGMAGIAGTVMVIYAGLLGGLIGNPLGNILIASVISTPAALALSALMVPFSAATNAPAEPIVSDAHHAPLSALDALTRGAMAGVAPLVGIVVMLIVAIASVALIDRLLALLGAPFGHAITLEYAAAFVFRPLLWLMGVPWREVAAASALMATKTVLNEFVAYAHLAQMGAAAFTPRTRLILSYALCGFANFGSLGILVGGLGAMVPERRAEIVALGGRSLVAGTLATCMSGAWAGLLAGPGGVV